MNQKSNNPVQTLVLFAAGTLLAAAATVLVIRFIEDKSMEHLARLAAGESDFENANPHSEN